MISYRFYVVKKLWIYSLILFLLPFMGCKKDMPDPMDTKGDLSYIPFDPVLMEAPRPQGYPRMQVPEDNPLTEAGVELGRFLFYDPILSEDSTVSCATCHPQSGVFTDLAPVSTGIFGQMGTRSAMTIVDVGFFNNGLFWDGRIHTLEEQVIDPVVSPFEMGEEWFDIEDKLQRHPFYPEMIRRAFGILNKDEIDRSHVTASISQFMRTIVNQGNSKFDKVFAPGSTTIFTDEELNGYDMFFDISPSLPDAECGHCHNAPLFTTNEFFNNGVQMPLDSLEFEDNGKGKVTARKFDNGKFRAPSLRNIALTAPYMHDGRFATLEEVIEHYNSGGHFAENLDPLIRPLHLTEEQKSELLAFLHTLTDTTILHVEKFSNPFE